jgi:two-component system OmpR family sensor kinase
MSIRRRLLLWLLVALTFGLAVGAASVYLQARNDANELFDYHLSQVVTSLPRRAFPAIGAEEPGSLDAGTVIRIWDRTGVPLYFSHPRIRLPPQAALGFSNLETPDGEWRAYSAAIGTNIVQAAQPLSVRRELAAGVALRSTLPFLILLPLLAIAILLTVRSGLAPLGRLAGELRGRSAQALEPVADKDVPEEALPLVHALNGLLARLSDSLESQRAFVADAAHELRTPLTALKLQLQLASRAQTDDERRLALAELDSGLSRATHLVEQLLTLAQQEPSADSPPHADCDLAAVARDTIASRAVIAAERGIDLGLERSDPARVRGDAAALGILLGNLVDNALRHTPRGGVVDVETRAEGGRAVLQVSDSGPGIPAAERDRVFDRFYRLPGSHGTGSGLGLAIVRRIADAHHASVALDERPGGGLQVKVAFPASGKPIPASQQA